MAFIIERATFIDGASTLDNELWSVSKHVVQNGNNNLNDVVLVQKMLEMFLLSNVLDDETKREGMDILIASTSGGGKFTDGIYGSRTRAAVRILENRIKSPIKDGIIRPFFEVDRTGRFSGDRSTKMRELNEIWDMVAIGGPLGSSKKETGRHLLQPGVFRELYPGG